MTDITVCPQCGTHFRITPAQRNAHQGMVRCGKCQNIFNAVDNLFQPQPQQLDLPLVMDEIADATGLFEAYDENRQAMTASQVSISPEAAARLKNDFRHLPDIEIAGMKKHKPLNRKIWLAGNILLTLLVLLQALYLFRVEIASRLPGLKPAMVAACNLLGCTIPLPQKIDLINIESSELEATPAQASIIVLHASMRSRAPYPLNYPNIELTLTDTLDNAVARRNFAPADYIPNPHTADLGLPANRITSIRLHLDTTDLKPAGYRLFLYYP